MDKFTSEKMAPDHLYGMALGTTFCSAAFGTIVTLPILCTFRRCYVFDGQEATHAMQSRLLSGLEEP